MCKPSQATTALACSAKSSVLASCVLTLPSRVNCNKIEVAALSQCSYRCTKRFKKQI